MKKEVLTLTVPQPWAWAVFAAGRDVLNVTRDRTGGHRGPVLVCAARRPDSWFDWRFPAQIGIPDRSNRDPIYRALFTAPWGVEGEAGSVFTCGAAVGVVDLVDAHRSTKWFSPPAGGFVVRDGGEARECSPWAQAYSPVHLVVARPRLLPRPFPTRGTGFGRSGQVAAVDVAAVLGLEALLG